jgi:hypothetical protein
MGESFQELAPLNESWAGERDAYSFKIERGRAEISRWNHLLIACLD